jgi:hypothetical protein
VTQCQESSERVKSRAGDPVSRVEWPQEPSESRVRRSLAQGSSERVESSESSESRASKHTWVACTSLAQGWALTSVRAKAPRLTWLQKRPTAGGGGEARSTVRPARMDCRGDGGGEGLLGVSEKVN